MSAIVGNGLPLTFRPVELATMALATLVVSLVVIDARSKRWEGAALIGVYAAVVAAYWVAGDR
jgi:Ca2+/H+ antiporter